MKKLSVFFTKAFIQGPPGLAELGPKRKSERETAFYRVYRRLLGIGAICESGAWLGLGHLTEDLRAEYPPREFGAFLSDLDRRTGGDCVPFAEVASLLDVDSEGYFTRYDARVSDLHCAVLFTLLPTPRLVVFGIGDKAHVSGLLRAMRLHEQARAAIAEARALA